MNSNACSLRCPKTRATPGAYNCMGSGEDRPHLIRPDLSTKLLENRGTLAIIAGIPGSEVGGTGRGLDG